MKAVATLLLALAVADSARAATAYVTDELVLGVYAAQNTQGTRLATLHSGATVDTLVASGDATQVRLADGTTGWVKSVYLTTAQPASVRLKLLQDEWERKRAAMPGPTGAAAHTEVGQLVRELPVRAGTVQATQPTAVRTPWLWLAALLGSLGCGFWLGYATLARRIKYKFGGIRVY